MSQPHRPGYEQEFDDCFAMLRGMSQAEHDGLLRDAGIIDEHGDLAARYRTVESTERTEPSAAAP